MAPSSENGRILFMFKGPCTISGCEANQFQKGLCPKHLYRINKFGDPHREPPKQYLQECTIEGCSKLRKAKGLCPVHYLALRVARNPACSVDGCDVNAYVRGWCKKHYEELGMRPCTIEGCDKPVKANDRCMAHYAETRPQKPCSVEGCDTTTTKGSMCSRHYRRKRMTGEVGIPGRLRAKIQKRDGVVKDGYRYVVAPDHPNANSRGRIFEHRLVMSGMIGRPLLSDETVHHKNGDRLDNRLENLELRCSIHPAGQRIEDQVAWAEVILERYSHLVKASA